MTDNTDSAAEFARFSAADQAEILAALRSVHDQTGSPPVGGMERPRTPCAGVRGRRD